MEGQHHRAWIRPTETETESSRCVFVSEPCIFICSREIEEGKKDGEREQGQGEEDD